MAAADAGAISTKGGEPAFNLVTVVQALKATRELEICYTGEHCSTHITTQLDQVTA
jgi:hypothetical protein